MKVMIENVRAAFPQLFEAKQINGQGKPKFGCSVLFPAGQKAKYQVAAPVFNEDGTIKVPPKWETATLDKIVEKVAADKWKDKATLELNILKNQDKVCIHDGNNKPGYDGYPGNFYLSASSEIQPTILNSDKTLITSAALGKPYSGCYVNISVDIYAQDSKDFGKRINASLTGIQFAGDGDSFSGGRPADASDFEAVEYDSDSLV